MTPFDQNFIENPEFLKWVFRSNPGVENYWKRYLLENPEEANELLELKERLTGLRFSNEILPVSEKDALENRIIQSFNHGLKEKKRRLMVYSLMKYAAVALIFAAIGGLVVYMNLGKENVYQEFAHQTIQAPSAAQGPLLITSNGENVNLKKSNSTIDYSRAGDIILNNDSILKTNYRLVHSIKVPAAICRDIFLYNSPSPE